MHLTLSPFCLHPSAMAFFPKAHSVNNGDDEADVVSLHSELDLVPEDVPAVHVRNLCKVTAAPRPHLANRRNAQYRC